MPEFFVVVGILSSCCCCCVYLISLWNWRLEYHAIISQLSFYLLCYSVILIAAIIDNHFSSQVHVLHCYLFTIYHIRSRRMFCTISVNFSMSFFSSHKFELGCKSPSSLLSPILLQNTLCLIEQILVVWIDEGPEWLSKYCISTMIYM